MESNVCVGRGDGRAEEILITFRDRRDLRFTNRTSSLASLSRSPPIGCSRTSVQAGLGNIGHQQVLSAFPPHLLSQLKTILGYECLACC